MKNKILLPDEWLEETQNIDTAKVVAYHHPEIPDEETDEKELLRADFGDDLHIDELMQAYAKYYHKAMVESVTDRWIGKTITELGWPLDGTPKSDDMLQLGKLIKKELLKRNEG